MRREKHDPEKLCDFSDKIMRQGKGMIRKSCATFSGDDHADGKIRITKIGSLSDKVR
jgi:hypothetical protein